jgi:LacI family transcriptional regulator
MSVVGFDNTLAARFTWPPLTTVEPHARTLGEQAARLTIERLRAPESRTVYVPEPPRLVVRGSTGRAPTP